MALALEGFRYHSKDVLNAEGTQESLPFSMNIPLFQCFQYFYIHETTFSETPYTIVPLPPETL